MHDYRTHPAWAFRDPVTSAREPIYSVHYNLQAARAMSVPFQYDVELRGTVTGTRIDGDGDHVADIRTEAVNQRGEVVMPGQAVVALPSRGSALSPAARRARSPQTRDQQTGHQQTGHQQTGHQL